MASLKFAPWSSDVELSFYATLRSIKINHDKLDVAARRIVGRYEVRPGETPERSARMQLLGDAFADGGYERKSTSDPKKSKPTLPSGAYCAEGILRNFNTIEDYLAFDARKIIEGAGRTIWEAIQDGSIYSCPSLLSSFHAMFFADLKRYTFTYHFAFPSFQSNPTWNVLNDPIAASSKLSQAETSSLVDAVQTWRYTADPRQHGFFLARREMLPKNPLDDDDDLTSSASYSSERLPAPILGKNWKVASLSSYEDGFFKQIAEDDRFICFADPSTYPDTPGIALRNLLALVRERWKLDNLQVLCYRDTHAQRHKPNSVILKLSSGTQEAKSSASDSKTPRPMPKVVGWERNNKGAVRARVVDLSLSMNPREFADQSVDLNIKLMKWRIAPDLDLNVIKNTKCLLLGAGTLGSYVSRNLLGWGVRKVTFVDNGRVSYSNPVRQPLFNFNDCLDGGVDKASRAAEALKEIYPGVDSAGYNMSVPMAGHPIMGNEEAKIRQDFEQLQKLIDEHDAIFLLMDTRESRWLPTVMGKAKAKIVMNAALGFDSYVVMRHGVPSKKHRGEVTLGCYFCNDVVAPADSLKDRTLDQQCTVTRPGIAAIASALLVEMLVSILQHPLRAAAPAPANHEASRSPENHPLGLVPHSIRGFLSNFSNILVQGPNYDCCSACSDKIVNAYKEEGWEFVKRALNDRDYVEELSGLKEVQRLAEEAANGVEWEEEDEEAGGIGDEGDGELI